MYSPSSLGNCGWIPQGQPDCAPPLQFNNHPNFNSESLQQIQAAHNEAQQQINIQVNENRHYAEQQQRENAERERVERENQAKLAQEEAARQAHETELRRLEHERFCAEHPLEAAEKYFNDTFHHFNKMASEVTHAENSVRESEQKLAHLNDEYQKTAFAYGEKMRHAPERIGGKKGALETRSWFQADRDRVLKHIRYEISVAENDLHHRRPCLERFREALHKATAEKNNAEAHLAHVKETIRHQQEIHAAHIAQQEVQRKAIEADEAPRKVEASNLKEQHKTQGKAEEASRVAKEVIAVRSVNNEKVNSLAKDFSFLSTTQRDLKSKEIAACETLTCEVGAQAKWKSIEASQALAFAGGMAAGVPAEFHDAVKGVYDMATNPAETYTALKALVNSNNVLGNVTDAVKEKWLAHIDNMMTAQERGGVAGYFEAGVEGGKLVTDVASIGLLGVGAAKTGISVLKSGVMAGEKILGKSVNKNPNLVNSFNLHPPIKTYGPHQLGPLGNPNDLTTPASTFRSGTYVEKIATEELYFYRDHGGSAKANGRFWTTEPSNGPLQSQLDSAILPEWGNTFENHSVIKIPTGTKYYEGYSASQAGSQGMQTTLHGGGTQIFLPSLKNEWILNK
ncbi:hypothetical protein ACL2XO_19585 [Sodalis sp. RH15]|uniref:hypothetical protein n=1 Tax=Sodalis sp. RH15 TaxID=3394330 RepID=UPI0039B5D17A